MTTVLLVTHKGIGQSLKDAAQATLQAALPCNIIALDCPQDADSAALAESGLKALETAGETESLIIFSDAFGATPHNIASDIAERTSIASHLISGVNLPMLMRTLNYIDLPLDELCEKAIKGGCNGICDCHNPQEHN